MKKHVYFAVLLSIMVVAVLTADLDSFAAVKTGNDGVASEQRETSEKNADELGEWTPDADNAIDELMTSITKDRSFDSGAYGLEGNYVVLQVLNGILETNGGIDRVRLVALRKEDGAYNRALFLEVTPSEGAPFLIPLPEDIRGIDVRIELKNFITLNKSEILLTINSGLRNRRFLIVEARGRQGRIFYDSKATNVPSIKGMFRDKYLAEILVEETGTRSLIDLSSRQPFYLGKLVYLEGTGSLRSAVSIWRSRVELQILDVDGDGIYELKQILELSGSGRSDLIAYVETVLKFEEEHWKVIDCWIAPAEDLANVPQGRIQ